MSEWAVTASMCTSWLFRLGVVSSKMWRCSYNRQVGDLSIVNVKVVVKVGGNEEI